MNLLIFFSDILYKCSVNVDGATQPVQIIDTSLSASDVTEAHLQWADAFVLVYSITDKRSFSVIRHMLEVSLPQKKNLVTWLFSQAYFEQFK